MAGLISFMNTLAGRILRIVLGLALIWYGFFGPGQGSTLGTVLGVIGVLPLVMGLWGRCMLQFVFGSGKA